MHKFGVRMASADQHYIEVLRSALQTSRIGLYPAPPKAELHVKARNLMRERRVDLLRDPRLMHQLSQLKRRPLSSGKIAVEAPHDLHGHSDMADAMACALQQEFGAVVPAPPLTLEQRLAREEQEFLSRSNRPGDRWANVTRRAAL
jgi:hypothetical protein